MAFKKQYLKSKPVCKVSFKITKQEAHAADTAYLVGDFNDWNTSALPMKKLKNGSFSTTLELAKDRDYQFRYLLDNRTWENDWQADHYVASSVSLEENSVIRI